MVSRDRTVEFRSIIKSNIGHNAVVNNGIRRGAALAEMSENTPSSFTDRAKRLGRNLGDTYQKLEQLSMLASQSKLFENHSARIQELTGIIRGDLCDLNRQIAELKQLSITHKPDDHNNRNHFTYSSNVLQWLQSNLANVAKNFKTVLESRTENLKAQKSRREEYFISDIQSMQSNQIVQRKQNSILTQDDVTINIDNSPTNSDSNQQQMFLTDQSQSFYQDRAETMESIESTVQELAQIFRQLATMIQEQEEEVLRIDQNVTDVSANVEAAHMELLKYLRSLSSGRWLMIQVFCVIVIFVIIFLIFFA
ncbi:syntaxin-5 [Oopsacas minuta]|uniref:Syntaxin-5 n=1 Tax=Oopsacas minuta TaxID=111878 RepID=A0AAV7JZX9_9METZ|nr:syntaxin-5 [Oopsacas minuta]